jgi:hypothetical protein
MHYAYSTEAINRTPQVANMGTLTHSNKMWVPSRTLDSFRRLRRQPLVDTLCG